CRPAPSKCCISMWTCPRGGWKTSCPQKNKAVALVMNLTRRDWLKLTGGTALAASFARSLTAAEVAFPKDVAPFIRELERPMFDLPGKIKSPVIIASIEMLKHGTNYFV